MVMNAGLCTDRIADNDQKEVSEQEGKRDGNSL